MKLLFLVTFDNQQTGLFRSLHSRILATSKLPGTDVSIVRVRYEDAGLLHVIKELLFFARLRNRPERRAECNVDGLDYSQEIKSPRYLVDVIIDRLPCRIYSLIGGMYCRWIASRSGNIASQLKMLKVNAIHCHWMPTTGFIAAQISRELGNVPVYGTIHGSELNSAKFCRQILKGYIGGQIILEHIFFVSRSLLDSGTALFAQSNCHFSPNLLSSASLNFLKTIKVDFQQRSIDVGYLGNFLKVKGADRLPSILHESSKLAEESRLNIVFIGDGPLLNSVKKELSSVNINGRFLGKVMWEDAMYELAKTKVLCVPSRSEGFPMILLEAAILGVHVIASDVGECRHFLGKNYVVDSSHSDYASIMANKLCQALSCDNNPAYAEISKNSLEYQVDKELKICKKRPSLKTK